MFKGVRNTRLELVIEKQENLEELEDAVRIFQRTGMHKGPQETFWVLAYGIQLSVATVFEVNRGMYSEVKLHLPTLLAGVLTSGVERFILAHNHPINDVTPSQSDVELTHSVMAAANATKLIFEDHLILTPDGGHFSFTNAGLLIPSPDSPYELPHAAVKR